MTATLIATGGTLAWSGAEQRMVSGAELAAGAGLTFDRVVDVEALPSWDLGSRDMQAVARAVCRAVDDGADAVVVSHGTDTLEETAWLTDLYLGHARRTTAAVVFTGGMRFFDDEAADGAANLEAALAAARASIGTSNGVQVSFAGRIHAARWARKVMIAGLDVFDSAGRPPTGPPPPSTKDELDASVALLKLNGVARPALPAGVGGLVVEGTGACHVPSEYHEDLRALVADGTPVVLATRVHDKPRAARSDGWFYACDLTAEKATLALMVGLACSENPALLEQWWDELMAGAAFLRG